MRQIAAQLKCVQTSPVSSQRKKRLKREKISLIPLLRLIRQWYQQYPNLKATQIHERLKDYATGRYGMVAVYTKQYHRKTGSLHGWSSWEKPHRLTGWKRTFRLARCTDLFTYWPIQDISSCSFISDHL